MSGLLRSLFTILFTAAALVANAQGRLKGTVTAGEAPVPFATVGFKDLKTGVVTDETGQFIIPSVPAGKHELMVSAVGYLTTTQNVVIKSSGTTNVLDAGTRSGARWTEQGGLLTMRFFGGLEGTLPLLLTFQQSHPPPQVRIPLIRESANYWRRTGGVGIFVPRVGG